MFRKTNLRKINGAYRQPVLFTYKQEIVGVLVAACFIFLALSFFSYNSTDNSYFYFSSADQSVTNWCGAFGAQLAAFSFFLLGGAAYVLLIALLALAMFLFRRTSIREWWGRFVCLPMLVLVSAGLLRTHQIDLYTSVPGGAVGDWVHASLFMLVSKTGTLVILYALLWISALVVARVSVLYGVAIVGSSLSIAGMLVLHTIRHVLLACVMYLRQGAIYFFALFSQAWRKKRQHNTIKMTDVARVDEQLWNKLGQLARTRTSSKKQDVLVAREPITYDPEIQLRLTGQSLTSVRGFSLFYLRNSVLLNDFSLLVDALGEQDEPIAQDVFADEIAIEYTVPRFDEFKEEHVSHQSKTQLEEQCRERAERLEEKLEHFGIAGKVVAVRPGPVITLFEYRPEIGSKISKIIALEDDLALTLKALSIRIIAPIPGRSVVGFEISNQTRENVFLSSVLSSEVFEKSTAYLPLSLGVDITGNPIVEDLVKMPHLLVAGSTGSGKSVGMNAMLVSMLCRLGPDDLKLILVDPKRIEFAPFYDIPHLLFPIVTNPRKAVPVLKWVAQEMEERYDEMARMGVRNIVDYQRVYKQKSGKRLPFLVIMIDELADLMMVAGKEVEMHIARIAQMARAAGIHMIFSTQRPSVDVLTGIIKVNFPSRIAFRVSSKIDSRTIIDESGAEKLLGRGDMLFVNSASSRIERVHGAYVSYTEIERLANYLRAQCDVEYLDINEVLRADRKGGAEELEDDLYDEIRGFVQTVDEISISLLQRRFRIGFNRSARLIEQLEMDGLVAPSQGGKVRKVLR